MTNKSKIKSRDALTELSAKLKAKGKIIGFTSGVFDLLHPGHVNYLAEAKRGCDVLIVGINSDASVKVNKGASRPINNQADRANIVAGLESVDYVFIFDEKNNNKNVELIRPDRYVKAGDYTPETLSSASIVESYGGRVVLVAFEEGYSSSAVIDRVLDASGASLSSSEEIPSVANLPAIFVDRDGTINEHIPYLYEREAFKLIPGALEGLARLKQAGYRIIVVTNQPGIGLGYFTKEQFFSVNTELLKGASAAGLKIDKIYYCPHSDAERCKCRKPETGMIERAVKELNIDLERSFVIGDMTLDLQLAKNAGCKSILVLTGIAGKDGRCEATADFVVPDLKSAADYILSRKDSLERKEIFAKPAPATQSRSLDSVSRTSAKISHDLNNILAPLVCATELIRSKLKEQDKREGQFGWQFDIIEASLDKARELSSALRGLGRPGELNMNRINLKSCIADLQQSFFTAKSLPALIELVAESDPFVIADDHLITQVVAALCLNALDAMEGLEERMIVIHLSEVVLEDNIPPDIKPGKYARLSVVDHGVGISEKVKARLFEPFFSTKIKHAGKGMGLSLVMAHEIMKKHGGTVSIRSEENCGTVVHLYFPIP